MNGKWIRKPGFDATAIFVHGLFSSDQGCWTHENGAYFPQLLCAEPDLESLGVYVFSYQTNLFSGTYSLIDVVSALRESLRSDRVIGSRTLIFIGHSMGGIVARKLIVDEQLEYYRQQKRIGVFLIASPSLGSNYANFVKELGSLLRHTQVDALRFSDTNLWLNDLDANFFSVRDKLAIRGKEVLEDKFAVFKRKFWFPKVVPRFSGHRYFPEPVVVPGSDHSSIAKPANRTEWPAPLLHDFIVQVLATPAAPAEPLDHVDRICGFWWGRVRDQFSHESALACIRIAKNDGHPSLAGKSFRRDGSIVAEWNSVASAVIDEALQARIKFVYLYEAHRRHDESVPFMFGYATAWFSKEPADPAGLAKTGDSTFTSVYEAASSTPGQGAATVAQLDPAASATSHDAGATAKTRKQDWIRVEQLADAATLWNPATTEEQCKEIVLRTLATVFGKK